MPSYGHDVDGSIGDFSLVALFEALDGQRVQRGLSWAGVAREVSARFPGTSRVVAPSTITGVRTRATVEGDGVLQMLLWLERSPESFMAGHPLAGDPAARLVDPGDGHVLRWDAVALHAALDEARADRGLGWAEVAAEVGCSPSNLSGLSRGGRVTLPFVMRPVTWLARPAATFTHATPW